MFKLLFSWPDQLPAPGTTTDTLSVCTIHTRLQEFHKAEGLLLSGYSLSQASKSVIRDTIFDVNETDALVLLFWISHLQGFTNRCKILLDQISTCESPGCSALLFKFLKIVYQLDVGDSSSLNSLSSYDWHPRGSSILPFSILHAEYLLRAQDCVASQIVLDSADNFFKDSLEANMILSRIYQRQGRYADMLDILYQSVEKFPQNLSLQTLYLNATVEARSHEFTIPATRNAIAFHGEHAAFYSHLCTIAILKHRSADARRYTVLDRLHKITKAPCHKFFESNYWVTQDRIGNSDWLSCLSMPGMSLESMPTNMLETLVLQNASVNGSESLSQQLLEPILRSYSSNSITSLSLKDETKHPSNDKSLTIAWISADINYHPVARFIYGFFSSCKSFRHNHILVDVDDHGIESCREQYEDIPGLTVKNFGNGSLSSKVDQIRSLRPDVAIDLNGWTGGNIMSGFYSRLAPTQVNYLGYFASTGIPSMDYWLGDSALFSRTHSEWHVESLYRLSRCFIAWQPADPLPEASIDVPEAIPNEVIRFGSFNNIRKLSDSTLKLWARILNSVPGSRLVLKAGNTDDKSTQELLRRRMIRQDFDVDRVIWLSRTATTIDHLNQYRYIDIALDCFPNGGCTTSCEALWMGVPVITLIGDTYVSRMSMAVLYGAGLSKYCARTKDQYFDLALAEASRCRWLRANRASWRHIVQNSPLGDASDLMIHLEAAFLNMSNSSI